MSIHLPAGRPGRRAGRLLRPNDRRRVGRDDGRHNTHDVGGGFAIPPTRPPQNRRQTTPAAARRHRYLDDDSARDLRDRWREAQLRFVDDPQQAAEDTRILINEVVEALTVALAGHREQLNSWLANGDTEQYRMIVQRYRTFFERLLTL